MKTLLNLTIDATLLSNMELYASENETSISKLVETYFKQVMKTTKRESLINVAETLKDPALITKANLKELYYLDRAKKYGF